MFDISEEYKSTGILHTSFLPDEIDHIMKSNKTLMDIITKYKNYCIDTNYICNDPIEKELTQCILIDKKYNDLNKALTDYYKDYDNVEKITILNLFKDIYETHGGPGSCTFID
jgi:hypothetical protein